MRFRIAAIIALGAIVAVIIVARNVERRPEPSGLSEALNEPVRVFDLARQQVVEMRRGRWTTELVEDMATGYRSDPTTGEKFAPVIVCASCGRETAEAPFPRSPEASPDEVRKILRDYRCPLCDGPAYDTAQWPKDVYDVAAQTQAAVTEAQWEKVFTVDPATGYRKDPQTGKVYAPVHSCAACGRTIAAAPVLEGASKEEARKAREAYRCPFCGQPAYRER